MAVFYVSPLLIVLMNSFKKKAFINLEPFKLPFAQALDMAADGRINDAKTVAALFRADRLMRKEREDGNG